MASIGGAIYESFKEQLAELVVKNYDPLVSLTSGLFSNAIILYVIITGFLAIRGSLGEFTKSAFMSMFIITTVYSFIYETYGYIEWFYYPLMDAIEKFSHAIISILGNTSSVGDFNSAVDASFSSIFKAIYNVGNAADGWNIWTKIKVFFAVALLLIIFGLSYVVYFGLMVVGLISIHIQFVAGIFLFWTAAFKSTRGIFFGWLKDTLTYALWPVYAVIVMGVLNFFIVGVSSDMEQIDLAGGDVFSITYGIAVLIGSFCVYLLFKVPSFAATLTGGTAGGFSGLLGGAVAGAAAVGIGAKALDAGKGADGQPRSRLGALGSAAGGTAGRALGKTISAIRGYSYGRKPEGD